MNIRLNKAIADTGYCSRRKADELIASGKVTVNGKKPTLGQRVSPTDDIQIGRKKLEQKEVVTVMLHKPAGLITSKSDPHHKQTVMSLLPKSLQHLKPAGRLDKDSEGLLILSSDGPLIQKLTHPKHGHTKTYEILVKGHAKESRLQALNTGMKLDGKTLNAMPFEILGTLKFKTRIRLTLTEGRKRQIRRVMDQLGHPVIYLKRTKIGKLELGSLPSGKFHELSSEEISKALS